MKATTKTLILFLSLTSLILLKIGAQCLFSQNNALQFFGVESMNADLEKIFIVFGGFIWATLAVQILTIIWLGKGKDEGYTLSFLVGIFTIGRALLNLVLFNSHQIIDSRLSIVPGVIGVIIIILTILAKRQSVS